MSRHVIDRPAARSASAIRAFWAIERHSGDTRHPAVRSLHTRPAARDGVSRLARFLRIARRGETA